MAFQTVFNTPKPKGDAFQRDTFQSQETRNDHNAFIHHRKFRTHDEKLLTGNPNIWRSK